MRALLQGLVKFVVWALLISTVVVKAGIWVIPNILMPKATPAVRASYNEYLLLGFTLNDSVIDPAWGFVFGLFTSAVEWTKTAVGMNDPNPALAVSERTKPAALIVEIVKNPLSWVYIIGAILIVMLLWHGPKKTWDNTKKWFSVQRILTVVGFAGLGYIVTNQGISLAQEIAPVVFIVMLILIAFMFAPTVTSSISGLLEKVIPLVITSLLVFFGVGSAASIFGVNLADVIRGFIGDNTTFAFIPAITEAGQNSMSRVDIPPAFKLGLVFIAMIGAVPALNRAKKAYTAKKPAKVGEKK